MSIFSLQCAISLGCILPGALFTVVFLSQGSYPDELKSAANSIVCTNGGFLLSELFNVTPSVERPVSFPPKHCNTAVSRCDQCLEQDSCGSVTGEQDKKNSAKR